MKWHFCAVWRQEEKSKIFIGRIRVKYNEMLLLICMNYNKYCKIFIKHLLFGHIFLIIQMLNIFC